MAMLEWAMVSEHTAMQDFWDPNLGKNTFISFSGFSWLKTSGEEKNVELVACAFLVVEFKLPIESSEEQRKDYDAGQHKKCTPYATH